MKFSQPESEVYVPDGLPAEEALGRTTHLCVAAHQDDIEIMAAAPIIECYRQPDQWFTGVVVTDGRGSPRAGLYGDYDDETMRRVRFQEQRKAAFVGEYAAQVMLDFPSKVVKAGDQAAPVDELVRLLRAACPQFVYTHNLADKHDTHVATALRLIAALRRLDPAERPRRLVGCEVWRSLDWMPDSEKSVMDVSAHENLQEALLGVFDSQIAGGKRYDLASMGRRRSNATYFESHGVDEATGLSFGMDLTPLIADPSLDPAAFIQEQIGKFAADVKQRMERLGRAPQTAEGLMDTRRAR